METLGNQLNNFFDLNKSKLKKFPIVKVIFRPITIHIHEWLDQFEKKDYFIWNKPNKNLIWTTRKAPSIRSQKRRVLTCFGFIMALPLGAFVFLRGLSSSGNVTLWAWVGVATVVGISWGSWIASKKLFDKQMESVEDAKELQLD